MPSNGNQEAGALPQRTPTPHSYPTKPLKTPPTEPTRAPADNIKAIAEELAHRITEAGRYAREHGEYVDQFAAAFAQRLRQDASEFAQKLVGSEQRRQTDLRQFMGTDSERR